MLCSVCCRILMRQHTEAEVQPDGNSRTFPCSVVFYHCISLPWRIIMDHFEGLVPKAGQGTGGRQAKGPGGQWLCGGGGDQRDSGGRGGKSYWLLPSPASPQVPLEAFEGENNIITECLSLKLSLGSLVRVKVVINFLNLNLKIYQTPSFVSVWCF